MRLSERDPELLELMDDPRCDPERLRRTLLRFEVVNRAVSRWDAIYRGRLRPVLPDLGRPVRVLDIGCGGGDVLRRLVRLARRDGLEMEALGIDPDPRAIEVAEAADAPPGIAFRRACSRGLVEEGARFDVVLSNHLLHHLDDGEFEGLLADSEMLAARLCLHADIARSRMAYFAFSVCVAPLAPGTFLREDGLRSIRRSYTRDELEARLPPTWHVEQPGAFRLMAVHRADAARS